MVVEAMDSLDLVREYKCVNDHSCHIRRPNRKSTFRFRPR